MPGLNLSPVGRFEKILLATEGSHYSTGAERVAIAMCAKAGAHLYAMTAVFGGKTEGGFMGPLADKEVAGGAAQHLDDIEKRAAEAGVACTKLLQEGDDPYKVIVQTSRDTVSDVVVMGRRGRRGLARLMLGDATAKVIGHAPCSVLVVPEQSDMWDRVLLATDGSRFSDAAAVTAAELGKCCNAPVIVLSVKVPFHSEQRQAEAQPIVDRVLAFMEEQGVPAEGMVADGVAEKTIVAVAAEKSANLIVLGNFGRTGLDQVLFGSKAERVINTASCPIMVVRSGG